ncbi:MAG: acyloxyacyl hydrolase [Deltaproteobacteria bacterium]|jgi:outer membrane autotransporter protein|nr:acyloxyacyl hydrolase [Deltaproteobacteria bacterium]
MMKRVISCLVLAAFFALPALAAAEVNGVYIAPRFLVGIQDSGEYSRTRVPSGAIDRYNQFVFGGALAVGYNFAPKFQLPIRAELEYAMRSASRDSKSMAAPGFRGEYTQTTNLHTLFVNAYFDINTGTAFTPYIGAGLGMAFNNSSLDAEEYQPGWIVTASRQQWDTTFAWNVGAGLSYAFTENIAADLGYRFVHTGYREYAMGWASAGSAPYIHEFYLGARFTF